LSESFSLDNSVTFTIGQDRKQQVSANTKHTSHALIMGDPFKSQSLRMRERDRERWEDVPVHKKYKHR